MKQISVFFTLMALIFNLIAQPATITWQGKLLDASGNAIHQNNMAKTFAMYLAETRGILLCPEDRVVLAINNCTFNK